MAHQHVMTNYMEHGFCLNWEKSLVFLHVGSDIITGISYYSIPIAMFYFAYKRRDIPFIRLFLMFAVFILSCGTTHFFAAYTIYRPEYWMEGYVKAFTALVSALTAVIFIPRIPDAINFPSIVKTLEEVKKLNSELADQGNKLASIINGTNDAVFIKDVNGCYTVVNDEVVRLFGKPRSEIIGLNDTHFFQPEDAQSLMNVDKEIMVGKSVSTKEERITILGKQKVYQATKGPVYDISGDIIGMFGISRDITELKQSEELIRESERQHRTILQTAMEGFWLVDPELRLLEVNEAYCRMSGYSEQELLTMRVSDLEAKETIEETVARAEKIMAHGGDRFESIHSRKDGSPLHVEISIKYLPLESGHFAVFLHDITERKNAEQSLVEAKTFTENALNTVPDIFYSFDLNGRFISWNKTFSRVSGYSDQELSTMSPADFFLGDDIQSISDVVERIFQEGSSIEEAFFVTKDGRKIPCEFSGSILRDSNDNIIGFTGIGRDISDRKHAEEERIKLESQLHQAQKMESVGSLAGGVAHDFNNKLSVILGHTYLALTESDQDKVHDSLEEIRKATEQSADLTRQLLAFARKQTIAPKVIDLNETVTGMFKMLNRLIGEDIHLMWQQAAGLWLLKFDPSQIDQILANLCVNARDAITKNGKITIETGNSVIDEKYAAKNLDSIPGEYVTLAVSDNGCGMDKETLNRIFEPFFTTKEAGKGTGLGLATVFGIVKQNKGFINVYSEPALGTTFTIYLPRFIGDTVQTQNDNVAMPASLGHETILLVEDELAILNMATKILTNLGYSVLQANTPAEAIRLAKEHVGTISLLITDVIMPNMNGKDLALDLQSLNPRLKCLYMSGYTADAISQHGVLDEGVHFIQKPFSLPDLATKVREILGE